MKLFTIGFTQKTAKTFFTILAENEVATVIDVRLNNKSQLAGFTKGSDLPFLLESITNTGYIHMPLLAPTKELLKAYKDKKVTWEEYEISYLETLDLRNVSDLIEPSILENSCFLCSEPTAERCHRRLLAEYFERNLGGIQIVHL